MRHIRTFDEKFITAVQTKNSGYLEIFADPSMSELKEVFKNDAIGKSFGEVRGVASLDGTLYVTSSEKEMIHSEIFRYLSKGGLVTDTDSWDRRTRPSYLPVIIENDFTVSVFPESLYTGIPANMDKFQKALEQNAALSYLTIDLEYRLEEKFVSSYLDGNSGEYIEVFENPSRSEMTSIGLPARFFIDQAGSIYVFDSMTYHEDAMYNVGVEHDIVRGVISEGRINIYYTARVKARVEYIRENEWLQKNYPNHQIFNEASRKEYGSVVE